MTSLEHDSLEDRRKGKKALRHAPEDKMIEEAPETKRTVRREIRNALREEQMRPHMDPDNPEIWDGEI